MPPVSHCAILYYHSIREGCLSVSPATFRRQITFLAQIGFRSVGVGELVSSLATGANSERRVAITFDDGFAGVWENAFPVLTEFGFRATLFIAPTYVGKTLWGDPVTQTFGDKEERGLIPFPMLTWDQIVRMKAAGIEIASHTLSHPDLTAISEQEAVREIRESKTYLEEKLGIVIAGFCFPRGRVSTKIAEFVREAGYQYACTTQSGGITAASNRYLLPRVPGPNSVSDLVFQLKRIPSNPFTNSVLRVARFVETHRPLPAQVQ